MKTSPTKFRMLGLALAAVVANVGFSLMHDPSFSVQKAFLLAGLCIAVTFVVHQAMTKVEATIARKDKTKV